MENAVQATPAQASDLPEIAGLLTVFGRAKEHFLDSFRHWWDDNPAWNGTVPRGWLVRIDGTLAAFTANIPFRYDIYDAPGLCHATGATVVAEPFRGRGLARTVGLAFKAQSGPDLLVGTNSTDAALRMWRSIGFRDLQRAWQPHPGVVLCDLSNALARRLPVPGLAAIVRSTLGGLAALSRSDGLDLAIATRFDAADDDALRHCRASTAAIYQSRSAASANWLFFGSDFVRRTRLVVTARRNGRLVGYLALKKEQNYYYLLECRTKDCDAAIARELLLAAREQATREGKACLTVWQYTAMISEALPRLLTYASRRSPMMSYTYCANRTIAEGDWEASPGDGDVCLY